MAPVSDASRRDIGPVVVVTPWFPNIPSDRNAAYVYESAAALTRHGTEVHVLVCRPWVPRAMRQRAPEWMRGDVDTSAFTGLASLTSIRYPGFPGRLLRPMTNFGLDHFLRPFVERLLRKTGGRIVHAHTEGFAPVVEPLARKFGCRTAVTVHGLNTDAKYLYSESQQRRFRRALNGIGRVILVGEPLRSSFVDLAGRDDHFRVVHNGLAVDTIPPRREALFRDGEPVRCISVSYLHEGKGIDVTLRALARLRERGLENWTYTIVGDGYQRSELEGLVDQLGLSRQVSFAGGRPREKVFAMLSEADVFVLPSYREAFGIAWLEAMAAGVVTIGVRGEGPSAFIKSGHNGFLVEPRDPDDLTNCLARIMGHPENMRAIAAAGRETVGSGFTWDVHARKLRDVYREML